MVDVEIWDNHYSQGGLYYKNGLRYLYNVCIREPKLFIDQRMVLEKIRECGDRKKIKHHSNRASWPIATPKRGQMFWEDATSDDLQKDSNKPMYKARGKEMWISEATWKLADQRTTLKHNHTVEH